MAQDEIGTLGKNGVYATIVRDERRSRHSYPPEEERVFPPRAIMTWGGAARRKVSSRKIYRGKVDAHSFLSFSLLSL